MGNQYKVIVFSLFFSVLFAQVALALSSTGSTDSGDYHINKTINYTIAADQNLTSNITIYLVNSSGTLFNHTSIIPNAPNFTTQINSTVPRSGDYFVKANFTLNNTYYESSSIVKISKAHSIVITTSKPAYSPGEIINFTVRATDINSIGISGENITVRLMYGNNDTVLNSKSGSTNTAGEYSNTFIAPNTIGTYRLTVNEWITTKIVDISAFDLVTFIGDIDGNIKTKFSQGATVYIYMDLFDTNKTRYTGSDTISVQTTYPNGTQGDSTSHSFRGSRINTSLVANNAGLHKTKVTVASTSKSVTLQFEVGKYDLVAWLEKNDTTTNTFFSNESVNVKVKVFNISTGEVIKTTTLAEAFDLTLLDSSFLNSSSMSNTSSLDPTTGTRSFTFNAPIATGLYYVRIRLNQTEVVADMKVANTLAAATPVDQSYTFKNLFVGNKQTIRILTTLSNSTSQINVTNITIASLKTSSGTDITSATIFNTSIIDYKGFKAGLVEFPSPSSAGLYFLKTLVNNNFAAETQFLLKFYSACAQLDGYKWFVSSNENVNLTVRVAEAQEVSLIDSFAGNASDSTNTADGNFSNIYGGYDCYGSYKTTASGTSTSGNNTANIVVTVKKIINTLNGEDVTTKVANLPSNNTDDNGKVALVLTKPSGGWDGGSYVVELELRDKNNNTDKGFGSFQVKNLWVNVWPQQISGRWRWFFAPTENMTFDVNAYNSTGTWYYYGQSQGTGDNCTVMGLYYQGNGAEWFWPPKTVSTDKYTWSCTNTSAPANGRFTLRINHTNSTTTFDSGYYLVRVKVNTTSGVGDVGDGWFSIKAYNVYVRTTSSNYYDSWYRGVTDNMTLDIDITFANSTQWDCYWRKCSSSELVTELLNISAKLVKYEQWRSTDYSTSKYTAQFANNSVASTTTNVITTLNVTTPTNITVNTTKNVTFSLTTFTSGWLFYNNTTSNVTRSAAGYNVSTTFIIPQNATINSANITVAPFQSNLTINISLNNTAPFLNLTDDRPTTTTVAFTSSLNSVLSSCTADANGNCTVGFNVTLNTSGAVDLLNLAVSYNQLRNVGKAYNISGSFTIPRNATVSSAFIVVNSTSNVTSGLTANISLSDLNSIPRNISELSSSITNLSTTANNVSFGGMFNKVLSYGLCTPTNNNCTIGFNITLNDTATVTLSSLRISYNTTQTTQNTSSSFINTTSGNANLTLIPTGTNNRWETGYYSAAVTVEGPQGKETGTYWFEIRSFFVNLQTVKGNGMQTTYSYSSGQNITLNVSATNKPSWLSSSYGVTNVNYIATNITGIRLNYWDPAIYQTKEIPVTWSSSMINNLTTINVTPGSSLATGNWYNMEVTLNDSNGNNQTGWASFQVKDFTFSTRTKNWKYEFTNAENISIDVAVCDSDTWWCNFDSNTYSGSNVNVNVTKLSRSDNWPYTPVSGWTANSTTLTSSSSKGILTIFPPTSNLSAGYYSAEVSAQPVSGGSATTSSVWFRIKSFDLSANAVKWEYKMSENATINIQPSASATLSDGQISCGYWPDQTSYSISDGTLIANSTSLSAGKNLIMLTPSGGKNWVAGYCSGYIKVSSGSESQTAYISFSMKGFTLFITQNKYAILKNESVVFNVSSDASQQFSISGINITYYNYVNGSDTQLRLGDHFTSNGTNQQFTGSGIINITPNGGNWTFKGWHNGKLTATSGAASQTVWFYFDVRGVFYVYGWTVNATTEQYSSPSASSGDLSVLVNTFKYDSSGKGWWPYNSIAGVNVSVESIQKQSCDSYPCTYNNVTGWTAPSGLSKSNGKLTLNITRSGGFSTGWHYMNLRVTDPAGGDSETIDRSVGFWVNA